ncbi:MAG: sulfur carrier protein ThiS adenylyltransferase ThiF [Acidobacteria bacterium]|nr:sulfur carrier protein ThiS adenylyltransferase ThiF [Acidobacteriota bacterium]MBU4307423.1 sulfur carrier protein ThiS adenylyltransferase ThiF [Acidobacteriota bacterium]MBU4404057.1 sulfur carrier protein ThiS adenylyltransferase ThiF [Acidobacteriota bacterium]MCG2811225.1 sulfur carrier protein ThiS adenylyltransferase ThiF [Candidatus Aminicenantes bacterium]
MKSKLEKLKGTCIGIAGCGGLGSNCAMALARAGVGTLVIADFDTVTLENLNRQYYFREQVGQKKVLALQENIKKVNPDIDVQVHDVHLGPDEVVHIFKNCQVIIEAFDLADMKLMIIETISERFPDKFIIAGSGLAGYGANNALRTRRLGNLFICGDETSEVSETLPPLAPRVGVVAALQANQALEIVMDDMAPTIGDDVWDE